MSSLARRFRRRAVQIATDRSRMPEFQRYPGLPDPFGALNPDLVEREAELEAWQEDCPCCIARRDEWELEDRIADYLVWLDIP